MIYKEIILSKNGAQVPIFKSGKSSASKYNPQKEAENFVSEIKDSSFFLVLGFASGFHIEMLNKKFPASKILVLEKNLCEIDFLEKNLLKFKELIQKKNIKITTIEKLKISLLENYLPVLQKNFSVIEWRPWILENEENSEIIKETIKSSLDEISGDFLTQSRFGKIWQHNILKNLKNAKPQIKIEQSVMTNKKTAAIIAAGPSLEKNLDFLKQNSDKLYIISTDTAFRVLKKCGIFSDAVVSIDGQFVSHSHFSGKIENETLFVFDLNANPYSVRKIIQNGNKIVFSSSNHPLSLYAELSQEKKCFPFLDAGSGTVTMSALDFAVKLGFSEILVFGADFSYLNGKTYAKGTYLDENFLLSSNRTKTFENKFSSMLFRTNLMKNKEKNDSTKLLELYRTSFENYLLRKNCEWKKENFIYKINVKEKNKPNFSSNYFDYEKFNSYLKRDLKTFSEPRILEKSSEELFNFPLVKALIPFISFEEMKSNLNFHDSLKLALEDIKRYT